MCRYSQKLPDNAFLTIRLEYQNLFKMTVGTLGTELSAFLYRVVPNIWSQSFKSLVIAFVKEDVKVHFNMLENIHNFECFILIEGGLPFNHKKIL